jgi:hypothetical protein
MVHLTLSVILTMPSQNKKKIMNIPKYYTENPLRTYIVCGKKSRNISWLYSRSKMPDVKLSNIAIFMKVEAFYTRHL